MTLRIASWRGILPRAGLLAVVVSLVPLPLAAAEGTTQTNTPTIKRSMQQIVARDMASAPASAAVARRATQAQNAAASEGFFKTRAGILAIVVVAAGTGYALYSASHDRILSAGKQ